MALKARDSLAGRSESQNSLASIESSIECVLSQTCESPQNISSFLREPDLTFGTDNDASGSSTLGSPLTSTPSLDGARKTKSLYISDSVDSFKSNVDPPLLGRTDILQRRVRTKAFSVSSLSTSQSSEDMAVPDRKRHAIYADPDMQFSIPSDVSRTSSVMSVFDELSPSKRPPYVTPARASTTKKIPWHLYTKSEHLSRRQLDASAFAQPPTTPKRKKSISTLPTLLEVCSPTVLPLRFKNKRNTTVFERPHSTNDATTYHPIVLELLQDLDKAIHEWKACDVFLPM